MNDGGKDARQLGRDEMNLAEYPITLLSDRADKGIKTIVFEGQHGKLTITGSDAYGLPTAPDADVIVALIQLTKLLNNFTNPTVPFTRYDVLKTLGWPDRGQYYRRLDESLNRWMGVTLYYENSWWDNSIKCRVDAAFHILECVAIYDNDVRRKLRARQQSLPISSFTWNKVFFQSCQADNLKRLDLGVYFGLRSAISKQLYRFMDKRFYSRMEWAFDLRELALEHVGLSRNYTAAKLKEKLKPALEELESIGFLEPMTPADRYANTGRGQWKIRLVRRKAATPPTAEPEPTGPVGELVERGVTRAVAVELARDFPEDRIRAQIERADWLRERRPSKVKDFGAYLADAIRRDYAAPAGFESQAERSRKEAAKRERVIEARKAKDREREVEARIVAYWDGLTPEQRAKVEAEALAMADPAARASCESGPPAMRRIHARLVREAYIRELLNLPTTG